jgi:hypothetical protein
VADVVAKAVFGVLIFMIAMRKSEAEGYGTQASGKTAKQGA